MTKTFQLRRKIAKNGQTELDWVGVYTLYDIPYEKEDDGSTYFSSDIIPADFDDLVDASYLETASDSHKFTFLYSL